MTFKAYISAYSFRFQDRKRTDESASAKRVATDLLLLLTKRCLRFVYLNLSNIKIVACFSYTREGEKVKTTHEQNRLELLFYNECSTNIVHKCIIT